MPEPRSKTSTEKLEQPQTAIIYYDGECPFCTNYVQLAKFKESVGSVTLVNVREATTDAEKLTALGYDLDEGMVLDLNGTLYHGADALNQMAKLSNRKSLFNKLNHMIFKNHKASKSLYPILRACRNLTLRILGRKKINK